MLMLQVILGICTLYYSYGIPIMSLRRSEDGFGSARHVLIFGIDGLGGVHLENVTSRYPGFKSFFDEGSYTTDARCETPTISASNWGTLITGMTPAESGIQANYWTPEYTRPHNLTHRNHFSPISGAGVPESIFDVIYRQVDLKVFMGYTWDWFHHFTTKQTVDEMFRGALLEYNGTVDWLKCAFSFGCIKQSDSAVYHATIKAIRETQPELMFLHFSRIDKAGHTYCWGCKEYYDEVKIVDGYIQGILKTLKETKLSGGFSMLDETLIIIVSDHGGYRKAHGFCNGPDMECQSLTMTATMNVPMLIRGPRIKKKFNMTANKNYVGNRDVVQTVLHALGLKKGQYMTGRVLKEIFSNSNSNMSNKSWYTLLLTLFILLK